MRFWSVIVFYGLVDFAVVAYGVEMKSTKRDLCCLDMICKISYDLVSSATSNPRESR